MIYNKELLLRLTSHVRTELLDKLVAVDDSGAASLDLAVDVLVRETLSGRQLETKETPSDRFVVHGPTWMTLPDHHRRPLPATCQTSPRHREEVTIRG